MFETCPYCHGPVPCHGTCCRVPGDLERFERVFDRVADQPNKHFLQENLLRYLVAYGRRPAGEMFSPLGTANSATSGAW